MAHVEIFWNLAYLSDLYLSFKYIFDSALDSAAIFSRGEKKYIYISLIIMEFNILHLLSFKRV